MVSILPQELRKKHNKLWFNYKYSTIFILIILFIFGSLFYTTFINQISEQTKNILNNNKYNLEKISSTTILSNQFQKRNGSVPPIKKECNVLAQPGELQCKYVTEEDSCGDNLYLKIHYCYFRPWYLQIIYYAFLTFWILVLFYLLGDTADVYLSPALIKLSDILRLPPNLAGVTLLAFGNGAPDLSSIIVAVISGNEGVGLSAPIGAGVFVTTFVFGVVSILSEVKVFRRPYIRDVSFYLFSVAVVFFTYITNSVWIWEPILFFAVYILYVGVVVVSRFINQKIIKKIKQKRRDKEKEMRKGALGQDLLNNEVELIEGENIGAVGSLNFDGEENENNEDLEKNKKDKKKNKQITPEDEDIQKVEEEMEKMGFDSEDEGDWTGGWRAKPFFQKKAQLKEKKLKRVQTAAYLPKGALTKDSGSENNEPLVIQDYFTEKGEEGQVEEEDSGSDSDDEEEQKTISKLKNNFFIKWFLIILEWFLDFCGWDDMGWIDRITFFAGRWTLVAIRNLTIYKVEDEEWNRYITALVPLFKGQILLIAIGNVMEDMFFFYKLFPIYGVIPILVFIAGIPFSVLTFFTTKNSRPPIYQPIFVVSSFAFSIMWIYLVADQLVNVLTALGYGRGIPQAILGITLLSWGNSAGDLAADVAVARQGYPSMAVGACFGAPMLNLLIGLGISYSFKIVQKIINFISLSAKKATMTPAQTHWWCTDLEANPTITISFIFLMFGMVLSLIVVPVFRFKSTKIYGIVLCIVYVIYMITGIVASFVTPIGNLFRWDIGKGWKSCPSY